MNSCARTEREDRDLAVESDSPTVISRDTAIDSKSSISGPSGPDNAFAVVGGQQVRFVNYGAVEKGDEQKVCLVNDVDPEALKAGPLVGQSIPPEVIARSRHPTFWRAFSEVRDDHEPEINNESERYLASGMLARGEQQSCVVSVDNLHVS